MKRFGCVVVLYKMSVSESPTLCSLFEQRATLRDRDVDVFILDNTPGKTQEHLAIDAGAEYIAFGENRGLAGAYQVAFLRAKTNGYQFLVLLDQDSHVDSGFINALDNIAKLEQPEVGIWCPDVISCGKRISPYALNSFGWPQYAPSGASLRLYGINSFSVVNVECIEAIGGFEQFYWLDCLDSWLYESAQQNGWTVGRLSVNVTHDLSLISGAISPARLNGIAFYESCFVIEYGSAGRIAGTILRIAIRGLKQLKPLGGIRFYWSYLIQIYNGGRVGLVRRRRVE